MSMTFQMQKLSLPVEHSCNGRIVSGWQQAKQRKAMREQEGEKESFWESSEYMTYWNKREEEDIDFNQGEDFFPQVEEDISG
jgi:hypothetical protein